MSATPARDALSPRQRWGTCCPNDPECDHSLMDVDILARYMDTPLSDLEAVMVEAGWGKDVVWDIRRHPDLVLAALIETGWRPTDDDLRAMGGSERPSWEYGSLWRFPKEAKSDGE